MTVVSLVLMAVAVSPPTSASVMALLFSSDCFDFSFYSLTPPLFVVNRSQAVSSIAKVEDRRL